jgi:hypothetical protein
VSSVLATLGDESLAEQVRVGEPAHWRRHGYVLTDRRKKEYDVTFTSSVLAASEDGGACRVRDPLYAGSLGTRRL